MLDMYTATKVPVAMDPVLGYRTPTKWVRLTNTMAAWFTTKGFFDSQHTCNCMYCLAKEGR